MTASPPAEPPPPNEGATVATGARLHFGLLAPRGDGARAFGGCGMMIDAAEAAGEIANGLGTEVRVAPSTRDAIEAETELRDTVERIREACRASWARTPAVRIVVRRSVPRHAGLGSGTQLALAVSAGIAAVVRRQAAGTQGFVPEDPRGGTQRGRRSAIGVHGFHRGGFLVESGKAADDDLGTLVDRVAVPDDWRIVLATPRHCSGLSGREERAAFAALPTGADERAARMRARIDDELVPALRAADFATFSEALREYGRDAGRAFADVQGGLYSHPETARLVDWFERCGARGVGQTSWGPTVFAFAGTAATADRWMAALKDDVVGRDVDLRIARPRNEPATISS